jgi:hypothetical protein
MTRLARVKGVVGEDGGQRHGEAGGGHDQRLADRAGDLFQCRLAGQADGDQRVIDPPDRAEEADERRGGAGGGEQGQTVFHAAWVLESCWRRARSICSAGSKREARRPVTASQSWLQQLACSASWA